MKYRFLYECSLVTLSLVESIAELKPPKSTDCDLKEERPTHANTTTLDR